MVDIPIHEDGRLADNIIHFARALRKAGMPVGPSRIVDAIRAVEAAGFGKRMDFYWTLHACFCSRREHHALFDSTFRLFWRDPQLMERMMSVLLRTTLIPQDEKSMRDAEMRAREALLEGADNPPPPPEEDKGSEIDLDMSMTISDTEQLKVMDFEQMGSAEVARAKRVIANLALPVEPIASRRLRAAARGTRPDWRGTMRASLRSGGGLTPLKMRERTQRWPNLVALCDISGSMSGYSRMLLHFLHAVSNREGAGWARVHSFVFGTRLTNITRHLETRDVDAALRSAGAHVQDWEGGTRIGECLHAFNRDWSRRVLGQGAVVLLITDGLDRGDMGALAREMERLHLSARKLIWLNPLLRWDGFAPKARGVRTMLPCVDSFRAAHNIRSLEDLAAALSQPEDSGVKRGYGAMLAAMQREEAAEHRANLDQARGWWADKERS
ncbi:MAG: VWA domain-containing protein [Neomegalonema sp.]|nr:VWA domain-containing protein [Neomegalonema sp.]